MTRDGFALAATIILLVPMFYFAMSSLTFLLVRLDVPTVTRLLRGLFNAYFLIVGISGIIGTIAFTVDGRPAIAVAFGCITAFAVWARRWFLQQMDTQISARDAGDGHAVRRLRYLHWGGMACNAAQLAVVLYAIPYVTITPT
ncbi:hypothetical protein X566_18855 [Afipia sp. P52-10]|uniref:hypothetical protein n=1 Tax=Afipia sp. P52-10 TaxID=1429916 RepID=UPI0003DF3445|nr:hypothetical protein [Afipia sp. P52-10]ETR74873.1 hypothetical protein X566_18855 [Afipia sp. P52-10]